MLFYLGLWAWVNGGSREEPPQIRQIGGLTSPQITQKGKPVRRRFSQMAADQEQSNMSEGRALRHQCPQVTSLSKSAQREMWMGFSLGRVTLEIEPRET